MNVCHWESAHFSTNSSSFTQQLNDWHIEAMFLKTQISLFEQGV